MRPGWPSFQIQYAAHEGDPIQWLMDLWNGGDAENLQSGAVTIGVVMSIPDYPYSHATGKEVEGVPIYGLRPHMMKDIHLCEMQISEAPCRKQEKIVTSPMYTTAGDYVLISTAAGESVRQAREKAYRTLSKLGVPASPMWRTDIGYRLAKQLPQLQAMGYSTKMVY